MQNFYNFMIFLSLVVCIIFILFLHQRTLTTSRLYAGLEINFAKTINLYFHRMFVKFIYHDIYIYIYIYIYIMYPLLSLLNDLVN